MVHRRANSEWLAFPGVAMIEDGQLKRSGDGKILYKTLIRFRSNDVYRRFQALILEELRRLELI